MSVKQFLFACFSFLYVNTIAQQYSSVGSWAFHTPYKSSHSVVELGDEIIAANKYSLYSFDKLSNNISYYNKTNVLSDIGISHMEKDEQNNLVLIGYSNGNLDIFDGTEVTNFDDIKRSNVIGSKYIENIKVFDNRAYIMCGFGVIVFDMLKLEFKDIYVIHGTDELICQDILLFNEELFAATTNGVYRVEVDAVENNPQVNWTKEDLPNANYNIMTEFNDRIFLNMLVEGNEMDTLFEYVNNEWGNPLGFEEFEGNLSFDVKDNKLLIAHEYNASIHNTNYETETTVYSYTDDLSLSTNCNAAIFDSDGKVWIADNRIGLGSSSLEYYIPSSPADESVFSMSYDDGKLMVAPGGVNATISERYFEPANVFQYQDFEWTALKNGSNPGLDTMSDVLKIVRSSTDKEVFFVATANYGVLKFVDNTFTELYNKHNSPLESSIGITAVSSIDVDQDGNLWIGNNFASAGIKVLTADGDWYSFSPSPLANRFNLRDIQVSESGLVWLQVLDGSQLGVLVYDHNGTIDNNGDDLWTIFSNGVGTGDLPTNRVYEMKEDLNGDMWMGTTDGLAVFYNPSNIVKEPKDAQKVTTEKDGILAYVLEGQNVTAIAIDGDNRKWVGTEGGGVFLLSEDGSEEIYQFNTSNSPLLSNYITCIEVHGESGEVFFGTDFGICSYRSDATEPKIDFNGVTVFPNPVKPTFSGVLSITGLTNNAQVKITDVSGNVVYQSQAKGGNATWNVQNHNGERVSPGVYLIYGFSEDGTQNFEGKVLISG